MGPFFIHLGLEALGGQGTNQNIDSSLVFVVAAAIAVVDPHNGFGVSQ
jgi:hypothetical protein